MSVKSSADGERVRIVSHYFFASLLFIITFTLSLLLLCVRVYVQASVTKIAAHGFFYDRPLARARKKRAKTRKYTHEKREKKKPVRLLS